MSIGFSSTKSRLPVRIRSLNSSALVMNRVCTMLLISRLVAKNSEERVLVPAGRRPSIGVYWKISR